MSQLAGAFSLIQAAAETRQVRDTHKQVVMPPNYLACLTWLAGIAALNVAILWVVGLRRRRQGNVSMFVVVGVAFLVSIVLHVGAFVMKGVEFAFAWGMLTVPLVWGFGFLVNLAAKIGWERLVRRRG